MDGIGWEASLKLTRKCDENDLNSEGKKILSLCEGLNKKKYAL